MLAFDAVRDWLVPGIAAVVIVAGAALTVTGIVPAPRGLASVVLATLVLLLYIGLRPVLIGKKREGRALAAGVAAVWLVACYLPFHFRLFPGAPLIEAAQLTSSGAGLPLTIPAAGHGRIDLVLEGRLEHAAGGGAAIPIHFELTVEDEQGAKRLVDGTFDDKLGMRRLGRRGTAVVHQTHTSELRVLSNPAQENLRVTQITLEPPSAHPILLTAFAHPLPGPLVLGLLAAGLLGGVLAFDRLGPVGETDGALTLSTAAVMGAAVIFWTSNAVHPDVSTVVGAAIFGGPLGFAVGAALWWVAKRAIAAPGR
jgi:hypothetical protein